MSRRRQRQTANGGRRFNRRSLTVSGGKATTDASRHRLLETSPSTQVNRGYGKVEGGQTTHGEFRFTVELGGGRCRLDGGGMYVSTGDEMRPRARRGKSVAGWWKSLSRLIIYLYCDEA